MQNKQTRSIYRIAYLGDDNNVHFAVGYDLGYVDPNYEYSEDYYEYSRGGQHILSYTDYTGKEVKRRVPILCSGKVNWLDKTEGLFDKTKVKPIVDKYLQQRINFAYARFKVFSEDKFEISFNNCPFYQGEIKAAPMSKYKHLHFNGDSYKDFHDFLDSALDSQTYHKGLSIATTDLEEAWEQALIDMGGEVPIYFYVEGNKMYMDTHYRKYQRVEVATVSRGDKQAYQEGVKAALIETAFEKLEQQ